MSQRLGVFRTETDPRTGGGLVAAIGQLANDVVGQEDYIKTGAAATAWSLASAIFGGLFTSVNVQPFTVTGAGTYTPTSGMKYCLVISTGGGGGGGGADTNGGSGVTGVGGGGGAGATAIELFSAATIGASQPLSVGAGGTAGSDTGGGNGGAGGSTTFGSGPLHTAGGGGGGFGSATSTAAVSTSAGGSSGTASGGLINITGGGGTDGISFSVDGSNDVNIGIGGRPGTSFWGGGGRARVLGDSVLASGITRAGEDGLAKGAGGSGAICLSNATGVAGGVGAAGIVVVIEFVGPA